MTVVHSSFNMPLANMTAMGFWDKTKEAWNDFHYTQEYTQEEAERIAEQMEGDPSPKALRRKAMGKAPLDYLDKDEIPKYFLEGFDLDIDDNDEGFESKVLVTEEKIVMMASSVTGKDSQYTVLMDDVIGVSVQRRLLSHIRVQTAGHSYKISVAASRPKLADEVAEYIRKRKKQIESEQKTQSEESDIDKLEKLGNLRDKGVISEEEFEKKKESIMERI